MTETVLTLVRTAGGYGMLAGIGSVDLSDAEAITFTYLGRFTVRLPWDSDLDYFPQRAGSGKRSGVERDGRDQLYVAQVQGRDALYPVRAGRVKKFSGNRTRLLTARKKRYTIDLF